MDAHMKYYPLKDCWLIGARAYSVPGFAEWRYSNKMANVERDVCGVTVDNGFSTPVGFMTCTYCI